MTPSARISAIITLYDMINDMQKPADQVLHSYFKQRKFVGSKDRKAITETIYTVLRYYARLSWWAERLELHHDGRSMMLLWLVLGAGYSMDDIHALFDGTGYAPEPLSMHERDWTSSLQGKDIMSDATMPEAIAMECPVWAYDSLKSCFGDKFTHEMQAMQQEAPLDMRVNTLKADRATILEGLQQDGFHVAPTVFSPLGLRVKGRPPFSMHPFYKQGRMEVQDEGSQLLALLCGAKPGEWVVDFCAGAGGKTLALAAQMNNKGRIWACDVEQYRLDNNRKRLRRSGVHCVEMRLLNNEEDDWVRKHKAKADCVLIDAPCSGVGTWRRNPFVRWQDLGPNIKTLTALQQSILQSASRLVKSGGRLLYATCSMLPEENGQQVDLFLQNNPEFKSVPLAELWAETGETIPEGLDLSGASLQLTPYRHQTDGFFISAMTRI